MGIENIKAIYDKEKEIKEKIEKLIEKKKKEYDDLTHYRESKYEEAKKIIEKELQKIKEKKEKEINKLIEDVKSETESELAKYDKIPQNLINDAKNFVERHLFD